MNAIQRRLATVAKSFNPISSKERARQLAELGDEPELEILEELRAQPHATWTHEECLDLLNAEGGAQ